MGHVGAHDERAESRAAGPDCDLPVVVGAPAWNDGSDTDPSRFMAGPALVSERGV
jgi:hypothetical protein